MPKWKLLHLRNYTPRNLPESESVLSQPFDKMKHTPAAQYAKNSGAKPERFRRKKG